ncbi:MAG: VOC family protein, partial [Planctomycetota bacterium]
PATLEKNMRITLTSVMVEDQQKALEFYTEVLGFVKKTDMPAGGGRWLTVASPEGAKGVELVLEPMGLPAARTYQKAISEGGIPATSFESKDIHREAERLEKRGVVFRSKPTRMGPVTVALFEDTCGNLLQLHQVDGGRSEERKS